MTVPVTIDALSAALLYTLSVMGVAVEDQGHVEHVRGEDERADVSSHLLVAAGERIVVSMATDERTARSLASVISGEPVEDGSSLAGDTLGEILNVVVGTAEPRGAREFSIPAIDRRGQHPLMLAGARVERVVVRTVCGPLRLYRISHAE